MQGLIDLVEKYFSISVIKEVLPYLLKGALFTVVFSAASEIIGIVIGLATSVVRVTRIKVLNQLAIVYVDLFRGTPLLMQIIFVYYALPYIGINLPATVAGIAALSINSGAYVTEIFRAGIESIDRGQMEAARSLGMSYIKAMRYIIIPQTIKRVLPPLTNEFVALIKDSSLLSVIAISELLRTAKEMMTWKLNPSSLTAAAILYLVITLPLTRYVSYMEEKLKRSGV
ncbi:MAG: Inner membrane amino-acid ABC transporter permease protein YecS [Actinobacteria bacterium ADurb.Bin346]|nr:MAG: Inner membrane amino-acid ABC transporter permease protein YecS [Actinobacteria bacterium ADurb.Bin346]